MTGGIALTAAFSSLCLSAGLPLLMAAVTLLAFSEMLADPLIQAMVSELAPHEAGGGSEKRRGKLQDQPGKTL
jgi:MFS family permease